MCLRTGARANFVIDNIDTLEGIKKHCQRVIWRNCVILGQIINKIFDLDLISLYKRYQKIIIHRGSGEKVFFWNITLDLSKQLNIQYR